MIEQRDPLLKLEEVAVLIGSSGKSINNWYMFKKKYPENAYARMLPDFIQFGARQTRYWKKSDVWKLIQFKSSIPQGRNGIMGSITQKYYHKNTVNEDVYDGSTHDSEEE